MIWTKLKASPHVRVRNVSSQISLRKTVGKVSPILVTLTSRSDSDFERSNVSLKENKPDGVNPNSNVIDCYVRKNEGKFYGFRQTEIAEVCWYLFWYTFIRSNRKTNWKILFSPGIHRKETPRNVGFEMPVKQILFIFENICFITIQRLISEGSCSVSE